VRLAVAGALLLASCAQAPSAPVERYAAEYKQWGGVDDRRRWAPTDCEAPLPEPPRVSASRDPDTHGRKLYYLFAKNREAYLRAADLPQPEGQVLVKESWHPAAASTKQNPTTGNPYALFLMIKTGAAESDAGWIYATVAADGKTVTASGKLASCMECHQAKPDRIFGLKSAAGAR